jgi:hypothetical protein
MGRFEWALIAQQVVERANGRYPKLCSRWPGLSSTRGMQVATTLACAAQRLIVEGRESRPRLGPGPPAGHPGVVGDQTPLGGIEAQAFLLGSEPSLHDYVVQSHGAFDATVRGILNLARLQQRVEVRVVVHKQTAPVLVESRTSSQLSE